MDFLAQAEPHTVSRILLESIKMMTNRIKSTQKSLVASWQDLNRQAYEDPGTGLWNQTFLSDEINRILETPSALIMLKPDRFKILVDSRGHGAGDEAMVLIAGILKRTVRRFGRGWSLRFKSNETGIFINSCTSDQAEMLAKELAESIDALPPVPARGDIPVFPFSGTVAWATWPEDDPAWESLLQGNYSLLLDTWRAGGSQVIRYRKGASK
jgi:diguanylate cyclase (GGDEF)-like protein